MDKLMIAISLNIKAEGHPQLKIKERGLYITFASLLLRVGRSWMRDDDPLLPGIKSYKEDKWCPHCINEEWVLGAKFFKISFDGGLLCPRLKK